MLIKDILFWMRTLVETVHLMKEPELTTDTIQIAGISIKILSSDPHLLSDYRKRWFCSIPNEAPQARIYVLSGATHIQNIPSFSISEISPAEFHEALKAEDMIAIYPHVSGQMQFMDLRKRIAIHLFGCKSELPPNEVSSPLRWPIQWILAQEKQRLAHAAAIGMNGKGVVLFGKGGSGKAGTTLAALALGMNTVGDDFIALGVHEQPFARAIFNHIKQDATGIERIPGLSKHFKDEVENWRGKFEFRPEHIFRGSFVPELRIAAAVLPSIDHQVKPSIHKVGRADALLALIGSNAQYDPSRPDGGLGFFADFLRQVPCYRLSLSSHALENGQALHSLLSVLD